MQESKLNLFCFNINKKYSNYYFQTFIYKNILAKIKEKIIDRLINQD